MNIRSAACLAALMLPVATPALAHTVSLPPGSSSGWVQQQPTRILNTDVAQVLPDDLAYISAGGALTLGRLDYSRGMGNGGELGVGLTAAFPFGGTLTGGFSGAWKQQLMRGEHLAIAIRPQIQLGFTGVTAFGAGVGLPFTFDAGQGHLTLEPRVQLPNVATAGTGTGDVSIGFQTPISDRWSLLAELDPTFNLTGGAFNLPLGAGVRFSPTATSHVDLQLLNVSVTPAGAGSVGIVGVLGHVGF